ncbi:hypothetical protein EJ08DRAFT_170559 [Tothia fuscella]|uniref:F-box domain-containing protein n=1 Tax=Tothia fuscella TaxID=1048955 RepID=A0A9P4NUI6_9PEZI|nr:hypothetical protein EJ08DRAFT_170559 [Tothia fuscella]
MASLLTLSNELLTQIVENIESDPSNALYPTLFVCKRLHTIASHFLYQHIHLKSGLNNKSTLQTFAREPRRCTIKSLRMQFQPGHLSAFQLSLPAASRCLETFYSTLRTLRLTTFAFNQPRPESTSTMIPLRVIINILENLPSIVRNLELDIRELVHNPYIYEYISTLIP